MVFMSNLPNGFGLIKDFIPYDILENYTHYLLQTIDKAEVKLHLGQLPLEIRLSQEINPIAKFLGNSSDLKCLIGSKKLFMHMPPMIRYISPHDDKAAVPPHQDISYASHLTDFLTLWIPLTPITPESGGVILYANEEKRVTEEPTKENWIPPLEVKGMKPLHVCPMEVGDVLFLSPTMIHASAFNISDEPRISIDLRIFGRKDKSSKHCIDLKTLRVMESHLDS